MIDDGAIAYIHDREAEFMLDLPTNPSPAQLLATAALFRAESARSDRLHTASTVDPILESGDLLMISRLYMGMNDPLRRVPVDRWIEAFARNGRWPGMPDPSRPLRLYRGCPAPYAHGLSWTSQLAIAKYHRDQWQEASVFELNTTWPELIAYLDNTPEWFEYLIDGRRHEVHEVPATRARNSKGRTP